MVPKVRAARQPKKVMASEKQIESLKAKAKCIYQDAALALEFRDCIEEFAIEYLERRDLKGSMAVEDRYPKWFQYKQQKVRV